MHAVQATLGAPVLPLKPELAAHVTGWVPGGPGAIAPNGAAPTP